MTDAIYNQQQVEELCPHYTDNFEIATARTYSSARIAAIYSDKNPCYKLYINRKKLFTGKPINNCVQTKQKPTAIHEKFQGTKGILPDLELPPTSLPLSLFPSWFKAFIIKNNCAKNHT